MTKEKIKKYVKTTVLSLISGKQRRIAKKEVADVLEQYTIGGGLDVVVVMVSGVQYIVNMSKQQVLSKIPSQIYAHNQP